MQTGKKKVGLFLPVPLADALDEFTTIVGKKQKWLIVGASLIRFLQSDQATQHELIRQVKFADLPGGSFDQLITSARQHGTNQRSTAPTPPARTPDFQQLVAIDDSTRSRAPSVAGSHRIRSKPKRRSDSR